MANSVSNAGITTTTDHIPTVPTTPTINKRINLIQDLRLSYSISRMELLLCVRTIGTFRIIC